MQEHVGDDGVKDPEVSAGTVAPAATEPAPAAEEPAQAADVGAKEAQLAAAGEGGDVGADGVKDEEAHAADGAAASQLDAAGEVCLCALLPWSFVGRSSFETLLITSHIERQGSNARCPCSASACR